MSKSLERLSTGMRINSAADDAAGLGVSENLRTQVNGLQQSLKNTQDVMSMLNIADGALNEQTEILQRMRELVIQAKNDTYTETERSYMGQEINSLVSELDRIDAATNFNGMRIFAAPEADNGEGGARVYTTAFGGAVNTPHEIADQRAIYGNTVADHAESIFGVEDVSSSNHFNMLIGANYEAGDIAAYNGTPQSFDKNASNFITIQMGQMDSNSLLGLNPANGSALANSSALFSDLELHPRAGDLEYSVAERQLYRAYADADSAAGAPSDYDKYYKFKLDYMLSLIDGKEEDIPNDAGMVNTAYINAIRGTGVNPDTGVRYAGVTGLERVNKMRSHIGALINRLEHTVNNTINQITNQQSAESLIRDADFASESTKFTRNQILTQSSTAMLAQANQVPQSVLQLLG
jgi:flagellin